MRTAVLIVVGFLATLTGWAQDMKSVFLAMPDTMTPLLTKVNKEDFIDFLASDMKAEVRNRFDNPAEMKVLTEDYVLLQTSAVGTLEMKLLPVNDSTKVVCMVKTVCASACDSEIRFYTTDWKQELDKKEYLQWPDAGAFFLPKDSLSEEDVLIRKKADMYLVKASLSKDDPTLTFIYTMPDCLNKEDKDKMLPQLNQNLVALEWKEGKFR